MPIKVCERCHREYNTETPGSTETHGPKCSLNPHSTLFKSEKKVLYQDESYRVQNEAQSRKEIKEYLEKAYQSNKNLFPEKDMDSKVQADFGGTSWAIYLTDLFVKKGYKVIPPKESEGPDITLQFEDKIVYIEILNLNNDPRSKYAVSPVPQNQVFNPTGREPEIHMRIKKGIQSKIKQRDKWLRKGKIDPNGIFLVALNSSLLEPFDSHADFPIAFKTLYPVGEPVLQIPINVSTGESAGEVKKIIPWEESILIKGETFVKDGFVTTPFQEVSGLIYSGKHMINCIQNPGDDVYLITNSKAQSPIPKNFLNFGQTIRVEIVKDYPELKISIDIWKGLKKS